MKLEGRIERDGKWWLAEIPILDVMTQGRTRRELIEMAEDLLETMVDRPGFKATVESVRGAQFSITGSEIGPVIALVLRRARSKSGLSLADVARRLGQTSPNCYARYEQGRAVPTIEKLDQLLRAVGCELVLGEAHVEVAHDT